MGLFDVVRKWRNEAAKRAATAAARATADRARQVVARAGEELLGSGAAPTDDEDRLGRAAKIRAEAEARRAREEAREAARDRADEGLDRFKAAVRRALGEEG